MKTENFFVNWSFRIFTTCLCILGVFATQAQVVLKDLSTYSQSFNTLPVNNNTAVWTDNATLAGWYVSGSNGVQISVNRGGFNHSGLMSYGLDFDPERALGHTSHGTYYGVRLQNNTGRTLTHFTVQYSVEVWHRASGNRVATSIFSFQKNTSALTGGAWSQTTNGSTQWRTGGGGRSSVNGNNAANRFTHVFTLPVTLAPGEEVMLRWQHAGHNDLEFGLDDISITPGTTAAPTTVFYSRPDVVGVKYLNNPDNWDNDPVGNGTQQPTSFSNAIFVVTGRTHSTINGNWVLGQNAKVIVNEGELLIPAAYAVTGKIDVSANATLTINNVQLPELGFLDDNSTVIFNSSAVLPAAEFGKLIVNNGSKLLSDDTQIKNELVLNGSLVLDKFNLAIGGKAQIKNASSVNYIVTNGAGRLEMKVNNDNRDVLFPVGSVTEYLPVKIRQTGLGVSDVFLVKADDGVYASYDADDVPAGALLLENAVNKTWFVDEEIKGGSDVTLTIPVTANVLNTTLLPGFDVQKAVIAHYENSKWDKPFTDPGLIKVVSGLALGYEVSRHGITTFSPFSLKNGNDTPLPVSLLGFSAVRAQNGIVCNWKTAQELNNDFFAVERSSDGRIFEQVGIVKGKGTTSQEATYTFTDLAAPATQVYYRLKQTDFDGATAFSEIVAVQGQGLKAAAYKLYPNPTSGEALLKMHEGVVTEEGILLSVYNNQGILIHEQVVGNPDLRHGILLDLSAQPAGMYVVKIKTSGQMQALRLMKQ